MCDTRNIDVSGAFQSRDGALSEFHRRLAVQDTQDRGMTYWGLIALPAGSTRL